MSQVAEMAHEGLDSTLYRDDEVGLEMPKREYEEGDLLSTAEAAEVLGVSRRRVAAMCRTGVLESKLIGNTYIIEWKHVKERRDNPPPMGRPPAKP